MTNFMELSEIYGKNDILPIVYPTFLQYVAYSNMQYLGLICSIVMIFARNTFMS